MIDAIATLLSITGAILNADEKISGFYIWAISNTMWIIYGIKTKQKWLVISFIVYLITSLYGIWKWSQ